jgi:maltooligosyltrehalose trehalohydrolase
LTQPDREPYRSLLGWYRSLLTLRRSRPELTDPRLDRVRVEYSENERWLVLHRGPLRVAANLGEASARLPLGPVEQVAPGQPEVLLASDKDVSLDQGAIAMPPVSLAVVDAG